MAQAGYFSCSGCGRLFRKSSPAELTVGDNHDCSWSDERLDREIGSIARQLNDER